MCELGMQYTLFLQCPAKRCWYGFDVDLKKEKKMGPT